MPKRLHKAKMGKFATQVINLIGGPGVGKEVFAAALIIQLRLAGYSVVHVPDVARSLVWQDALDTLANQHEVAKRQYTMLDALDGEVEFIITDGPLIQQMYYNENYLENISNVTKANRAIRGWLAQFNNLNVFLDRGTQFGYTQPGRYQTEAEARAIDPVMKSLLTREKVEFHSVLAELPAFNEFIKREILAKNTPHAKRKVETQ